MAPKDDIDPASLKALLSKEKETREKLTKKWIPNFFETPFWRSIFRHKIDDTPRNRSLAVLSNVFLHLQPAKLNRDAVRYAFCWGMGGIVSSIGAMHLYASNPDVVWVITALLGAAAALLILKR